MSSLQLQGLRAVRSRGKHEPELLRLCSSFSEEYGPLSTLVQDADGNSLLGLESHASRLWQRKLLRDGGSGKVLLTARASTVRQRRRWTIFDGKGRVAMDVCISRIWWHRKAHGEGPARYVLRAYEPHFSRPCIVAGPEGGRLVLRTFVGKKQQGDALAEAAYDGSLQGGGLIGGSLVGSAGTSTSSNGNGSSLPSAATAAAAAASWDTGCHAAVAPRAETPLMCCLLAIYQHLLDEDASTAAQKAVKERQKGERRQQRAQSKADRKAAKQAAAAAAAEAAAAEAAAAAAAVEAAAAAAVAAEEVAVEVAEGEASLRNRWALSGQNVRRRRRSADCDGGVQS